MNHRTDRVNRNALYFFAMVCFGGLLPLPGLAQTIVWTDENGRRIQSKDVSGGPVQTLAQFPVDQAAYGIQHDPITGKLYYHFWDQTTSFRRINIDGSNPETIPTPSAGTFAINTITRKLYWTPGFSATLNHSNLDGSDFQTRTYSNCCYQARLAIGNDLYLSGYGGVLKGLWRADADGSNEQLLVDEVAPPTSMAYDPVDDKIYVATGDHVYRMNRDGSSFQWILIFPEIAPVHIALDYQARKLYWASGGNDAIRRSDFSGANAEHFLNVGESGNPNLQIRGLTIVQPPIVPAISAWGLLATGTAIVGMSILVLRSRSVSSSRSVGRS